MPVQLFARGVVVQVRGSCIYNEFTIHHTVYTFPTVTLRGLRPGMYCRSWPRTMETWRPSWTHSPTTHMVQYTCSAHVYSIYYETLTDNTHATIHVYM